MLYSGICDMQYGNSGMVINMTSKGVLLKINCNQLLASICLGALILLATLRSLLLLSCEIGQILKNGYGKRLRQGNLPTLTLKRDSAIRQPIQKKKEFDPRQRGRWHAGRIISEGFLKDILFRKEIRDEIRFEGVQIIGAHFEEPVILPRFDVNFQLVLENVGLNRPSILQI